MKTKLCLILADCPIYYCGGLGVRFNKMLKKLEEYYELKLFVNSPKPDQNKKDINFKSNLTYIQDLKCYENIYKLNYEGFGLTIFSPLGVIEYIYKSNWIPEIILCTDHQAITTGLFVSKIFNSKFILEYDLALFCYEKLYNKEFLNERNKVYSTIINETEMLGCCEADLVIMCSKYFENNCPYKIKKVTTVENGVNIYEFDKDIKFQFPNSSKNDINIVYIGRLNSQKGVEFLLNLDLKDNIKLYFVGPERGGNLYKDVIESCNKNKNYYYLGEIKGEEKIGLLKSADAILFPSIHEPFGIVGLETMAAKTICITTRVDGISSYMEKDMCIEIKDYNILEAIDKFINMTEDEKIQIINKAYEQVKNYDWSKITERMIKTIDSVL
jgi:glycosyltransferase involved in cell wall biosynthesis